jgi:VWFA-related protein
MSGVKRLRLLALLAAALCVRPVYSQSREGAPSLGPKVVRLNVAALDAGGKAVTDLKSEEIQISDAGKPQQIVYFRRDDNDRGPHVKLPAGEYSNRGDGLNPRVTAVLFDLLNEDLGNRGYGADEIVHALQKLETPEYVYLYMLTKSGGLFPVRPVPGPDQLLQPSSSWTQQFHDVLATALRTVTQLKSADMRLSPDYIPATYRALEAVSRQMMLFPGRKNLVWITQGVPLSIRDNASQFVDFTPQVRLLSAELDRRNVAVVPVLLSLQNGGAMMNDRETVEMLTDLTGGPPKLYSDVPGALDQALQTGRAGYRVVYDPPAKNWDGKFHKIKVTCTRAGVHLQTQQGYFADPSRLMPGSEAQSLMEAAAASPFDIREVGLNVSIPQSGPAKGLLKVRVNLPDVLLLPSGEKYQGELMVQVISFYSGQQPKASAPIRVPIDLTQTERNTFLNDGLMIGDKEPVGADLKQVRVVVLDAGSGSIGALNAVLP